MKKLITSLVTLLVAKSVFADELTNQAFGIDVTNTYFIYTQSPSFRFVENTTNFTYSILQIYNSMQTNRFELRVSDANSIHSQGLFNHKYKEPCGTVIEEMASAGTNLIFEVNHQPIVTGSNGQWTVTFKP